MTLPTLPHKPYEEWKDFRFGSKSDALSALKKAYRELHFAGSPADFANDGYLIAERTITKKGLILRKSHPVQKRMRDETIHIYLKNEKLFLRILIQYNYHFYDSNSKIIDLLMKSKG